MVGFIYGLNNRRLKLLKVLKIVKWLFYNNIEKAKSFIEIYIYFKL